jgi:hypothetical protein
MRAAVEVELRRVPDAVVVIRDQVIAREGRDAAFVVVEKEGKTLVEARPLTLGARDGQHLHVLEASRPASCWSWWGNTRWATAAKCDCREGRCFHGAGSHSVGRPGADREKE